MAAVVADFDGIADAMAADLLPPAAFDLVVSVAMAYYSSVDPL